MKNISDGGEAVVQAFRCLGVDYVMSSPGSEWGSVWEALARQKVGDNAGPSYLSCAHETLAVNLATGYTLVTGRLQAVMLHTGVGLLQGSMGIDAAMRQAVPMLVVSGESITYGDRQGFDPGGQWQAILSVVGGPQRLVEPLVKWASQAGSVDTLYNQLVSAGSLAQRTPAGPTYLAVPIETQLASWAPPAELRQASPPSVQVPSAADIEAVAGALVSAKAPLIIAESIGRQPAGQSALVALAELLSIPVVEPRFAEFANFPKTHELYQGFAHPDILSQADLILTAKCKSPWYPPSSRPAGARVVAIDDTPFPPHMVYHNAQADLFLEGDPAATLDLVAEAVRGAGIDADAVAQRKGKWAAEHSKLNDANVQHLDAARARDTIDAGLVCATLSEVLADDAIYVDETITYKASLLRHLQYNVPQSYFRTQGGLGQGLGVALGVKLAARDRCVVSIMGDGTFMYNPIIQSLALSRNEDLPILIVILNNGGYDAMKKEHRAYYPDGAAADNDLFYGFPVTGLDYEELAKLVGGFGQRVETPAELRAAIEAAVAAVKDGKTAILNIITEPVGNILGR